MRVNYFLITTALCVKICASLNRKAFQEEIQRHNSAQEISE